MDILRILLGAALLAGFLLGGAAFLEARRLTQRELLIPVQSSGNRELRLLHISDTHGSRTFDVLGLAAAVKASDCDLVVMTGDLVSRGWDIADGVSRFTALKEPGCLLFVPGNHDLLAGKKAGNRRMVEEELSRRGVHVLTNTVCVLDTPVGRVLFAGVDDKKQGRPIIPDCSQTKDVVARILLSHNPDVLLQAREGDWDLVLCGHTHGGQIRLPIIGPMILESQLGWLFWRGPQRYKGAMVVVSQGTGTTYLPMRLLCPPQVWLCRLIASDDRVE